VDQALGAINMAQGAVIPVAPVVEETAPVERERLFDCDYFRLWRLHGQSPFAVGAAGAPRVLVCLEGMGQVERGSETYAAGKGDVWLLPAAVGVCAFRPSGPATLLEVALPE
jgi:mannose-6-phosphate isomerase